MLRLKYYKDLERNYCEVDESEAEYFGSGAIFDRGIDYKEAKEKVIDRLIGMRNELDELIKFEENNREYNIVEIGQSFFDELYKRINKCSSFEELKVLEQEILNGKNEL